VGLWGGWDSNPRPTDYESSPPAALVRMADLGRYGWIRSWLPRFGHVFGMIKLAATAYR
jgi:homospermidine synthase